jgi:hypothetical protein
MKIGFLTILLCGYIFLDVFGLANLGATQPDNGGYNKYGFKNDRPYDQYGWDENK